MKQSDIKPCCGCGKGVMHDNCITFYRLKVSQLVADLRAIQRQSGLEMMLGSPALAAVMGPSDDIAKTFVEHDVLLCFECTMKPFGAILERLADGATPSPTGGTEGQHQDLTLPTPNSERDNG